MRTTIVVLLFALLFMIAGCGGSSSSTTTSGTPINTGNWSMTFTDASSNKFLLSALFSQNGSVVTGANVLGVGNVPPFSCIPFSATFGNGQVVTNQFSGDFTTPFGNVHFTSALNAKGTAGAYWQDNLHDANGNTYVIAGGPGNFTPGLGLDRSFKGLLVELHDAHGANPASYSVSITH